MTDTLARASMMYEQHREHLSPQFEIVYLILAKGSPGDMEKGTHDEIEAALRTLAQQIPRTKVRVVWQWIPIV